ncbi:MAG: metallophosphoesterase family protein [bacterium]|nr:metallophosphoesterase family protein [bacterium]
MHIAVISDTHDNEANLQLALRYFSALPIDALIHCGDITTPETLALLAHGFSKPIHAVFGNCDVDRDGFAAMVAQFPHVTLHGDVGEVTLGNTPLAFVHYPKEAKDLATTDKYRYVFHGHTHKPWEEKISSCTVLNPGTLAGMWYKATFALVDLETGKAALKLVERLGK